LTGIFSFGILYVYMRILKGDDLDFLRLFKALGDETRLRLVNLFVQSNQAICVCEMTDALLVPQYQISRHLIVLKNLGLMATERVGTWIYYSLNRTSTPCTTDLMQVIEKHFKKKYAEDIRRLNDRLAKRDAGRCVIGYALSEKKEES